jgi:hypothetical protein
MASAYNFIKSHTKCHVKCTEQANPETKSRLMVARGWEDWGRRDRE